MSTTAQPPVGAASDTGERAALQDPRNLVDLVLRAPTFVIVAILALFVLVTYLMQPSFLSVLEHPLHPLIGASMRWSRSASRSSS